MPTIDEVNAALERLNEAKESGDTAAIKAASQELNDLRQQWKLDEIAAGQRILPSAGGNNDGNDAVVAPATIDTTSTAN